MFSKRCFFVLGTAALVWLATDIAALEKEKPGKGDVKVQDRPKLPDGVIHVALPPGELRMENIVRKGKFLIRLNVDKTVIEARNMFLGDSKGATHFEAMKDGIHWAPASGGKGFLFGNGGASIREPGSTIEEPDYYALDKLKAGSVFLTTPSVRFVFGPAAKPRPTGREGPAEAKAKEQDGPDLPAGVINVAVPPGILRMEDVRDGRTLLRVTVGKTVIEARTVFMGDGKGATRDDAMKGEDAIKGGHVIINEPGSTIIDEGFVPLPNLKAGSLYVTTPSIIFRWGKDANRKP